MNDIHFPYLILKTHNFEGAPTRLDLHFINIFQLKFYYFTLLAYSVALNTKKVFLKVIISSSQLCNLSIKISKVKNP